MREVRLDYTKFRNAKYISHLDLNRVFFRAVRRAEIPLWFTEGYNPKPYFKYAQTLPLGVESKCESVDIRLLDDNFSNAELKKRLNAVLPDSIPPAVIFSVSQSKSLIPVESVLPKRSSSALTVSLIKAS